MALLAKSSRRRSRCAARPCCSAAGRRRRRARQRQHRAPGTRELAAELLRQWHVPTPGVAPREQVDVGRRERGTNEETQMRSSRVRPASTIGAGMQVAHDRLLPARRAASGAARAISREVDRVGSGQRAGQREVLAAADRAVFAQDSARRDRDRSGRIRPAAIADASWLPATMTTGHREQRSARVAHLCTDVEMRCATLRSDGAIDCRAIATDGAASIVRRAADRVLRAAGTVRAAPPARGRALRRAPPCWRWRDSRGERVQRRIAASRSLLANTRGSGISVIGCGRWTQVRRGELSHGVLKPTIPDRGIMIAFQPAPGGVDVQAHSRRNRWLEAVGKGCRAGHRPGAVARREADRVLCLAGLSDARVLRWCRVRTDVAQGIRLDVQEGGRQDPRRSRAEGRIGGSRIQYRARHRPSAVGGHSRRGEERTNARRS